MARFVMKIATVGIAAIGAISLGYLLTRKAEPEPAPAAKPARSRKTTKGPVAPRRARRADPSRRKPSRKPASSST